MLNSCFAAYAAEKPLVIADLNYVNTELTPHRVNLKYPVIDIAAQTDQGLVDIECQIRVEPSINDRLMYYLSSLTAESLYRGENYSDAPPVIIICLHKYRAHHPHAAPGKFIFCNRMMEIEDHVEFSKKAAIYTVDLAVWREHFTGLAPKEIKRIDRWLDYLTNEDPDYFKKAEYLYKNDEIMTEVAMAEKVFTRDDDNWFAYLAERNAIMAAENHDRDLIEQTRRETRSEAHWDKNVDYIKKMKKEHVSLEVIMRIISDMPEEDIARYYNEA